MEAMGGDLFATKGLEYLLVIGYLLLLVACRSMVGPRRRRSTGVMPATGTGDRPTFHLRDGLHYHQGHAWAGVYGSGVMRVGIDDFAQRLVGPITGLILPPVGTVLNEGEPAWKLRMGRRAVPVLSPVTGEVVRWNDEILASPNLVNSQPYDGGWVMEVSVRSPAAATRNLLSGELAHAWLDDARGRIEDLIEAVPEDSAKGAEPTGGLARMASPDAWDRLASEVLLTADEGGWSPYGEALDADHDRETRFI
jgi:glycine cleavage system H lipoate-binding protein